MDSIFPGLSLIIVLAAAIALFMRAIGQPLLIGHIITGIIVGPAVFHITQDSDTFKLFSDLGIALLLFIIGLGMNPKVVREVGKASFIVTFSQIALTTTAGLLVGMALGLT